MTNAFIFDFDGVLIDDEQLWESKKQVMYRRLFGQDVAAQLGSTLGIDMDAIFKSALAVGTLVPKQVFVEEIYKIADEIYKSAPITAGTLELMQTLKELDYHIGVVSASPIAWITTTTKRSDFENYIELIISLYERDDLAHKPAPDGYREAIRMLGAEPESSIILEDSNPGIQSAKASGAYVIGLQQNLASGYIQTGADAYAGHVSDVIAFVRRRSSDPKK